MFLLALLVAADPPGDRDRPRPGRLDNLGSSPKHHCAFCDDDGWVVYQTRPAVETVASLEAKARALRQKRKPVESPTGRYEELAPCPHCARGAMIEFGAGETPGPWGKDGFWRTHSPSELRPRVTTSARLTREDQRAHLRAFGRTLGFVDDGVLSIDDVNAEPGP